MSKKTSRKREPWVIREPALLNQRLTHRHWISARNYFRLVCQDFMRRHFILDETKTYDLCVSNVKQPGTDPLTVWLYRTRGSLLHEDGTVRWSKKKPIGRPRGALHWTAVRRLAPVLLVGVCVKAYFWIEED